MKNKFVKVTLIALLFVTVVCTTKSVCYAISTSQVSGKLNSLISQYENKNSCKRSKTRRSDTVPILRYDIRSLFI